MTPLALGPLHAASHAAEPASPPKPEVLRAAREFESIFVRTLLSSLEKTTHTSGSSLSAGQSAYGSMVVGAMADAMTNAGGIGLAEVVARALSAHELSHAPGKVK